MKKLLSFFLIITTLSIFNSCEKANFLESKYKEQSGFPKPNASLQLNGHLKQTKTYSSEVVTSWLNMQLNMLRVPLEAGTGSQASERCQAYCGIATYEAVVNGMPAHQSLYGQLTDFPQMPSTEPGKAYHWAASANAALAEMNRKLFPTTSLTNKTAMDNLESTLEATYASEVDAATLDRSIAFGKEVASRVFAWAATDGSANVNPPYVAPVGLGFWVPTAPSPAVNPYAYQRRLLVPDVANGTALVPPPDYDAIPLTPFYEMVKEVYDKSLVLTPAEIEAVVYFRDAPGYPGGGAFVSILSQVLDKAQPTLDIAALAYVKVGLAQHDATIILFTNKYNYKLIRPITYIRNEMGFPLWSPTIPTPNHPEFPSGHAVSNSSIIVMLNDMFGTNFPLTLHTYDYLPLPPRSYNSFNEMGQEMSNSRFWGGLHYRETCEKSEVQGRKVGENILNKIKFLK
ncbi:MAG: vanadium-dependent haloperoxidase [Bacteroidota bacterium]